MIKQADNSFFQEINKLPILVFINLQISNLSDEVFFELVDDLIIRQGCQIDRLHSSLFNFNNTFFLSDRGIEIDKVFRQFTSLQTKQFKQFSFESKKNNPASGEESKENNPVCDENCVYETLLGTRKSYFFYMGTECSLLLQQIWESRDKAKIYQLAKEAHELLRILLDEIIEQKITLRECLENKKQNNIIFKGFIEILTSLNDLDRRNFILQNHLFYCGNPTCSTPYYIAKSKNQKYYCNSKCRIIDNNAHKNQEVKKNLQLLNKSRI